ncbi:MAG: SRPBCC domain-containing protein [Anaerolineales bacterium]
MTSDKKFASDLTPQPAVVKSVDISASAGDVWQALTEPDKIAQWMNGARVESTWEAGSDITFSGTMPNFDIPYRDIGTILAVERGKFLKYNLWSQASRRPDLPQNRTVVTLTLEWTGQQTHLSIHHEGFRSESEYKHANFFWTVAPSMIKKLCEQ